MSDVFEQALLAKGYVQNADGTFSRPQRIAAVAKPADAPELESTLRDDIDKYCRNQWPQWLIIAARTDRRSTIAEGAHDVTIFADKGRTFCFELKSKTGKPTVEQLGWAMRMQALGHVVKVIRSMTEFLEAVK